MTCIEERVDSARGAHVILAGCGGNIGSHVVPHLGRTKGIGRATLIDRDCYESANLDTQDIVASDVGKPKAIVQADRLRRINPALEVNPIVDAVENIPLGSWRCKLILTGLDSKIARMVVSRRAWQTGAVLVDGGVDGAGLLARVSVYFPGPDQSCLQCGWSGEYETVEQEFPCTDPDDGNHGKGIVTPPTGAPASLGALTGSLMMIECQKIFAGEGAGGDGADGDGDNVWRGKEILMDAAHGHLYVASLERDPDCRSSVHDHGPLIIERANGTIATCTPATTLREVAGLTANESGTTATPKAVAFGRPETSSEDPTAPAAAEESVVLAGGPADTAAPVRLRVVGQSFVTRLTCCECGARRNITCLKVSLGDHTCRWCQGEMVATGFDTRDELAIESLSPRVLDRSLESLGVRVGDVLVIDGNGSSRNVLVSAETGVHA